jgi:BirA family biotin operon repressor/biotin-[acetyl-CoA-carboxylase] ligase
MSLGLRVRQARLLRALADAGGEAPLPRLAGDTTAAQLDEAVADLLVARLVALDARGTLSCGSRGSLLVGARVQEKRGDGRYGRELDLRADVESTNDLALAGEAGPGWSVAAELQVKGRGRRGRSFDSRPGLGLWCTTVVDPPADPADAPRLSLVAALAAADAVDQVTGLRAGIKWPNDVRIDGRKVCGVLVEARTSGGALRPVVGVGINVHHEPEDFPEDIRSLAGSLESAGERRVDRSDLFATLLTCLERRMDQERAGTLDLVDAFSGRDELHGKDVQVTDAGIHGVALGIDPEGRLVVEAPGGVLHALRSGEASVRAA